MARSMQREIGAMRILKAQACFSHFSMALCNVLSFATIITAFASATAVVLLLVMIVGRSI
jgi:hypothetical protein